MALDNIHVEQAAMTTAVSRSNDVHTQILEFEKQLSNISDLVKENWGGKAQQAFDTKHQEIRQTLGTNALDALDISEGTNNSLNTTVAADDAAYAVINAINGVH
jgi:uncharacterized protein YukE